MSACFYSRSFASIRGLNWAFSDACKDGADPVKRVSLKSSLRSIDDCPRASLVVEPPIRQGSSGWHPTARTVPLQVLLPFSNELAIRWLQQDQCTQPEHSACWVQQASQGASGRTGTQCADLSAPQKNALITRSNAFDTRCVRSLETTAGVKTLLVEFSVMDAAVTTNC